MEVSKLCAALVKAQREFSPLVKNKVNPHFKSKYADLSACVDAVLPALNKNGIALVQCTRECDDGVTVETVLIHESGEQLAMGPLHIPVPTANPQAFGSALQYARRYSLCAAVGISADDMAGQDDDANAATEAAKAQPPKMAPAQVADWLSSIQAAAQDELDGIVKAALDAATVAKDRDAYRKFRDAGKARKA